MKISKLAILVVLSLGQGAALAEAEKLCRVAGIYINQNKSFAIVELPDGKYLLVHEGDTFAEGRILEISSQGLRIASPTGEQRLYLTSLSCHPVDIAILYDLWIRYFYQHYV